MVQLPPVNCYVTTVNIQCISTALRFLQGFHAKKSALLFIIHVIFYYFFFNVILMHLL